MPTEIPAKWIYRGKTLCGQSVWRYDNDTWQFTLNLCHEEDCELCSHFWAAVGEAEVRDHWGVARAHQAVGSGRNESKDVVSEATRKKTD